MSIIESLLLLMLLFGLLASPFVLYPLALSLVPPRKRTATAQPTSARKPLITIAIPAHNEQEHISEKVLNTLALDYPRELMEILVCSDGSTDHTEAIVAEFKDAGVLLMHNEQRTGKAATLNRLLERARGDLVLLTDASAVLSPNLLAELSQAFEDPGVGAATVVYRIGDEPARPEMEDSYWSLESRIKSMEADRDMLLGLHGAAFMIRRALFTPLPVDTINDDFVIPLLIREKGQRIAYVRTAAATEQPTDSWQTIFNRISRITKGNYQMCWRYRRLLAPGRGRIAFPFVCRKLLKTLGPLLLLSILGLLGWLSPRHPAFLLLLLGAAGGILLGGAGILLRRQEIRCSRLTHLLAYGLLGQCASFHGLCKALFQRDQGPWKRAPENEPLLLDAPATPPAHVLFVKRLIDLTGALVGLTLGAPLLLLVSAAVKLESRGPAIFRQSRIRFDDAGTPITFTMLKFRSMRADAETASGPVWASEEDPRITRVGRFIRKCRLDEIP